VSDKLADGRADRSMTGMKVARALERAKEERDAALG